MWWIITVVSTIVASVALLASPANAAGCSYSKTYSHKVVYPAAGAVQWTFHFDITVSNDSSCTNFTYSPSVYASNVSSDWPFVWYYRGVSKTNTTYGGDYTATILRQGEFDDILTGVSNLPYPALYPQIVWTVYVFDGTATAADSTTPGTASAGA